MDPKHIWDLKNKGINYNITWSIAAYASECGHGTRRCDLCITEKYIIACANQKKSFEQKDRNHLEMSA